LLARFESPASVLLKRQRSHTDEFAGVDKVNRSGEVVAT
jgi:hypothetical protein